MNFQSFPPISTNDIRLANKHIQPYTRRTPLLDCSDLTDNHEHVIILKLENLQITGSFKLRGAFNKMLSLSTGERKRGVITVSSGNHGHAVGYAAQQLGIRATIVLPETVPPNKISLIRELGAEIITKGTSYEDADGYAHQLQRKKNLTFVHPFDDPAVIAGQGTIGLELLEDFPDVDTVVVPLSGGGLLSGIALALKSINPKIQVVGVTMERGAAMVESLKAGEIVDIVEEPTLADALAGGIGMDNRFTFPLVQDLMDEAVLVSEEQIAQAMIAGLEKYHLVIEGGGAVGLAAIMEGKIKKSGDRTAIVISGGNVEIPTLYKMYQKNLKRIRAE